jgi:outer membrane protein assembly factor BamE (lipoprotein component of BamABCDE complex)
MFYAIPRIAYGDDAQIDELRNRIEYLEKKVETMNQTLIKMMAILDSSSSVSRGQQSVTPDRLKWQDKQNWRRLRSGMSKGEVTDLLGEPDRIDNFGGFEVWRYGYPIGGEVQFSSEEKIDSWHEP